MSHAICFLLFIAPVTCCCRAWAVLFYLKRLESTLRLLNMKKGKIKEKVPFFSFPFNSLSSTKVYLCRQQTGREKDRKKGIQVNFLVCLSLFAFRDGLVVQIWAKMSQDDARPLISWSGFLKQSEFTSSLFFDWMVSLFSGLSAQVMKRMEIQSGDCTD